MTPKFMGAAMMVAALVAFGCTPADDEAAPRPAVAFTGQVDANLVGNWKSGDGGSTLELGKDGSLALESVFNTPKGKAKSNKKGSWLADGEKLRLRYRLEDGSDETVAYSMKVSGNHLTLSTKVPKTETLYERQ